jgi:hypothetical protein
MMNEAKYRARLQGIIFPLIEVSDMWTLDLEKMKVGKRKRSVEEMGGQERVTG